MQASLSKLTDLPSVSQGMMLSLMKGVNADDEVHFACVVQMFISIKAEWVYAASGILTAINYSDKNTFFLRMFDLRTMKPFWECEFYYSMLYCCPSPFFHFVETDTQLVGISFASSYDARNLKWVINKLARRVDRRTLAIDPRSQPKGYKDRATSTYIRK